MQENDWYLNAFVLQSREYSPHLSGTSALDEIYVSFETKADKNENQVLMEKSSESNWNSSTLIVNKTTKLIWRETHFEIAPSFQFGLNSQLFTDTSEYELSFYIARNNHTTDESFMTKELVVLLSVPSSGQVLLPIIIHQPFSRNSAISISKILFAKVAIISGELFYLLPNRARVQGESNSSKTLISRPYVPSTNLLQNVDEKDVVAESNGARAGRPSHKVTSELLITPEQGQKILEIRKRWEGLSARQRRVVISAEDFYPFLTLNRDETAQHLGVCATWLKDTIRLHGMKTWPARPLRRSGAYLQCQKENLKTTLAKLNYTPRKEKKYIQLLAEADKFQRNIAECVQHRCEIVKENVSNLYFQQFILKNGAKFLNPCWTVHPPERQLTEI